ncbi:hypothetical protein ACN42_g7450 [Penicillium freii]|uniref:Uncharacterized protein n=1 Tax=Penicillium freii TaxID=48697 RepID=A0A124GQZ5_PENFR|nr:hypothetical protein ACN42_g7450 [Penicillium freii]
MHNFGAKWLALEKQDDQHVKKNLERSDGTRRRMPADESSPKPASGIHKKKKKKKKKKKRNQSNSSPS